MPNINTILFDCDNTLVQSEALAFQACAGLANKILIKADRPEQYTGPKLQRDFVGQNFRGMLKGLVERHDLDLAESDIDTYVGQELAEVIQTLKDTPVKPCEGALEALADISTATTPDGDKYLLSVVSSSAYPRVETALVVTGMDKYFGSRIYSAATSLPVPTSKPDPAIYLFSCEDLKRDPTNCVAIEDSKSGATAAVRAGISLIGYVGVYDDQEERDEAEQMLRTVGTNVIMYHWSELKECLAKIQKAPSPVPKI